MILLQEMIGVAMALPVAFIGLGLVIFALISFVFRVLRAKNRDEAKKIPYFVLFLVSFFLSAAICVSLLASIDGRVS